MALRTRAPLLIALLLTGLFEFIWARNFHPPFPILSQSLTTNVTRLSDFVGIAAGFRRLAADIAWIETLEYYGNPEENLSDQDRDNGGGHYPLLAAYCSRVAQLDPYFTYVYYYGGGSLGWNLGRWKEAEDLLKEGIRNNPRDYRLPQYLAAIAFRQTHDATKLIEFLASFVQEPDCPNLLRSILANVYKRQGQYAAAIRVWLIVYDTGDRAYRKRAEEQIQELSKLAHLGS